MRALYHIHLEAACRLRLLSVLFDLEALFILHLCLSLSFLKSWIS